MSIHNFEQCIKGWSLKGQDCIINLIKANIKDLRFTALVATTKDQILNYTFVKDSMVTCKFTNFMIKLNRMDKNRNFVYFMDNAKVHTSVKFRQLTEKLQLKIIYNAPYYSKFNPIEMIFSLLRKEIQKGLNQTKEEIVIIINNFIKDMNKNRPETLNKIFRHAFGDIDKFLLLNEKHPLLIANNL